MRAPISHVGVCEQLPNGNWYITGWDFDIKGGTMVQYLEHGCPFMHDGETGVHVGFLGWLFADLKALSDAQQDIAKLETVDPAL